MNGKRYQKVYSVNGILQAVSLQVELEKAGIPTTLANAKCGAYLDILVPETRVYDAINLLYPDYRAIEISPIPQLS